MLITLSAALPVLVKVSVCEVLLMPMVCAAKLSDGGLRDIGGMMPRLKLGTAVGLRRLVLVPSPSWPYWLVPHAITVPSVLSATV